MQSNEDLTGSGRDLMQLMLRAAGLIDNELEKRMEEIRKRSVDISDMMEKIKLNFEIVIETEQDRLLHSYKSFLQQSSHEIEHLRKKYDVENLKLIKNETFKSLEKAFTSLKFESSGL